MDDNKNKKINAELPDETQTNEALPDEKQTNEELPDDALENVAGGGFKDWLKGIFTEDQ